VFEGCKKSVKIYDLTDFLCPKRVGFEGCKKSLIFYAPKSEISGALIKAINFLFLNANLVFILEIEENLDFLNPKNRRLDRFLEVTGICNICGKAGKMHTCSLCGNIVCKSCYDAEKGICKSCKRYPGKRI
jgi:hypothetical protein